MKAATELQTIVRSNPRANLYAGEIMDVNNKSGIEGLLKSQNRNYTYFILMATNPDFDILRSDPCFLKIIDEIGLAPYNTGINPNEIFISF